MITANRTLETAPAPDRETERPERETHNPLWVTLSEFRISNGKDLLELSHETPLLLVFLRHLGCTFCRETLADIAARKDSLKEKGVLPVFVHMSEDEDEAESLFADYKVADLPRVGDPGKKLYRLFGLKRGSIRQVIGPKVMWRGFVSAILSGHGFGMPRQDPLQLPGLFLLHRGQIVKDFRHETSADRPDYNDIGNCEGCQ